MTKRSDPVFGVKTQWTRYEDRVGTYETVEAWAAENFPQCLVREDAFERSGQEIHRVYLP